MTTTLAVTSLECCFTWKYNSYVHALSTARSTRPTSIHREPSGGVGQAHGQHSTQADTKEELEALLADIWAGIEVDYCSTLAVE